MLDQVRTMEPAQGGREGRVLTDIRMNTDYNQTVSKGGCSKQSAFWPRSSTRVMPWSGMKQFLCHKYEGLRTRSISMKRQAKTDVSAQTKRETVHFLPLPFCCVQTLKELHDTHPHREGNLLYHSTDSSANLFWKHLLRHSQQYSFSSYLGIP